MSGSKPPAASSAPGRPATHAHLAWLALLLLPGLTIARHANTWDAPVWQLLAASAWMTGCAWLLLPRRLLLVLSFPLVLAGIVVLGADLLRGADLLELLAVRYTFRPVEVRDAAGPYLGTIGAAAASLLALAIFLWRQPGPRQPRRPALAGLLVTGGLLALLLPAESWRGAWPSAFAGALLEGQAGDAGMGVEPGETKRASPRPHGVNWQAQRPGPAPEQETYVLVIGESVRSDRVPGCGGRTQVTPPPESALLFCDVLAGASGTHVSVPLLISRDLPGSRVRVPHDATLQKAFEAVGFETFWLGVQDRAIAWPDARNVALDPVPGRDRERLLPLLDRALVRSEPRKMIVLHAYNAHSPYIDRYDPAVAPFRVDSTAMRTGSPRRQTLPQWWDNYDNAIDESMRFLREATARLQSQPGEVFAVFTPDHAENMLDDGRGLTDHALARPTLWDTRVPVIVWANEAWHRAHPAQWRMLAGNVKAPLMHMDVVPTLLGAAGIRYAEPRTLPVDLGARAVPPRVRFTQLRPGRTVTLDTLGAEAQED